MVNYRTTRLKAKKESDKSITVELDIDNKCLEKRYISENIILVKILDMVFLQQESSLLAVFCLSVLAILSIQLLLMELMIKPTRTTFRWDPIITALMHIQIISTVWVDL